MLKKILIPVLLSFSTVAAAQTITLDQARQQIDDALPGDLANDPLSFQWETWGPKLQVKSVDTPSVPGGISIKAETKTALPNKWDAGINVPLTANIAQGQKVRVYLWARSDGQTDINTRLQQSFEPYAGFGDFKLETDSEWKLISYEAIADRNLEAGKAALTIQVGGKKQSVEIGQIYITKETIL